MKVFFLLLAKDEEQTIGMIINDLRFFCQTEGIQYEIGLADDSSDNTPQIAKDAGAHVFKCGSRGLGHAFKFGVSKAVEFNPDIIITLDADGQSHLKEIRSFLDPIIFNEADVVTGSRFLNEGSVRYKYPAINRFGIYLLSSYLSMMLWQKHTDSHGGIRSMRVEVARGQTIYGPWTYVQESLVDAHERGFRVKEVACIWNERIIGNSKVVHSVLKYVIRVGPYLLLRVFRRLIKILRLV